MNAPVCTNTILRGCFLLMDHHSEIILRDLLNTAHPVYTMYMQQKPFVKSML